MSAVRPRAGLTLRPNWGCLAGLAIAELRHGRRRARARTLPSIAIVVFLTCFVAAADAYAQLRAQLHASGLTSPVGFVQDPTDRSVQFVVEQPGRIRVIQNGAVLPTSLAG